MGETRVINIVDVNITANRRYLRDEICLGDPALRGIRPEVLDQPVGEVWTVQTRVFSGPNAQFLITAQLVGPAERPEEAVGEFSDRLAEVAAGFPAAYAAKNKTALVSPAGDVPVDLVPENGLAAALEMGARLLGESRGEETMALAMREDREPRGQVKVVIEVVRDVGPTEDNQRLEVESVFETGADQPAITEGIENALARAVAGLHELRLLVGDGALKVGQRFVGSKEEEDKVRAKEEDEARADERKAEMDRLLEKQYEDATGGRTEG